jgi:hypothetical protein
MAGLGNEAIGNHQVAERIEDTINLPLKCQPALARDPAQIAGHRPALPFQHQGKKISAVTAAMEDE